MVCAYPAWEYATNIRLLKLQSLQNRIPNAIGNFDRRTPVSEILMVSKFLAYTITTQFCRKQR
jgi:hypothetical protein